MPLYRPYEERHISDALARKIVLAKIMCLAHEEMCARGRHAHTGGGWCRSRDPSPLATSPRPDAVSDEGSYSGSPQLYSTLWWMDAFSLCAAPPSVSAHGAAGDDRDETAPYSGCRVVWAWSGRRLVIEAQALLGGVVDPVVVPARARRRPAARVPATPSARMMHGRDTGRAGPCKGWTM